MDRLDLHTGLAGDQCAIVVHWFDHNNCHYETVIEVAMQEQDKPRTLEVKVDGRGVFLSAAGRFTYQDSRPEDSPVDIGMMSNVQGTHVYLNGEEVFCSQSRYEVSMFVAELKMKHAMTRRDLREKEKP